MDDTIDLVDSFGAWDNFIYKAKKPTNAKVALYGINDAPFVVKPTIENRRGVHPAYEVWCSMLKRCYVNPKPTYTSVTVCSEWLIFTNFAKWFKNNYTKGAQLDKDLLVKNNKIYGPTTCIFTPPYINSFLTTRAVERGEYPIGVSKVHGSTGYQSRISDNLGGRIYLGYSEDFMHCHRLWQKAKLEQAIAFDFPPLQRVIDQLKYEIDNNLETISL